MSNVSRNIELVFKTNDITKLNKTGYNFVMNMSGFIAHYNLYGFQDEYQFVGDLLNDIANSMDISSKERYINDSFFNNPDKTIGNQTYKDYYRQKYETLAELEQLCIKYRASVQKATQAKTVELARTNLVKATDFARSMGITVVEM